MRPDAALGAGCVRPANPTDHRTPPPAQFITPSPSRRSARPGRARPSSYSTKAKGSRPRSSSTTSPPSSTRCAARSKWRNLPNPNDWQVTPETARLLQHWRHHEFTDVRPFFCQVEAVETAIWLTEVAPHSARGQRFLEHLANANRDANPELMRLALKLATGAGKTTVMAMLIAWQTINAVRRPGSKTLHPRLSGRRARPDDQRPAARAPAERSRQLLRQPRARAAATCSTTSKRAKIVITNYHAFKLRERIELSKGGRALLQGRGEELNTLETEGQMLQRVMPELMGMKNILVLNDEAHHCYREKPQRDGRRGPEGRREEGSREEQRSRAALDLRPRSRQPQARHYARHRSLRHAVLPARLRLRRRHAVPLDDERLLADGRHRMRHRQAAARAGRRQHPRRRDADVPQPLGTHPQRRCRRRAAARRTSSIRSSLPPQLQTALEALYGHYEKTFELWQESRHHVPPCFIVVCNNTSTSKLVYDYISGFHRENEDGSTTLGERPPGAVPQFRRARQPARPAQHAADRQRAARIRRGAGRQFPRHGGRRDRALPPRDRRAHRRSAAGRKHHRPGPAPRSHEHRRQARPARRDRSAASSRSPCSPKAGTPTPSPTSSASALSAPSFCASRSSAARCAASPTISTKTTSSTSNTPTSSAFRSTSPPSRSSRRHSRRARPSRSRPSVPSATRSKSASRASRAIASNCPRSG